jgi:hypothetical protein
MSENGNGHQSISDIIRDGTAVEEALDKAFYRAVLLHREANVPMWFSDKDGKPCSEDAKDIPIPEKYANLEPFRY